MSYKDDTLFCSKEGSLNIVHKIGQLHFWIPHEILTLVTQQVYRAKIIPSGLKMPMTYLVQNSRGTLFWAKKGVIFYMTYMDLSQNNLILAVWCVV